MLTILAHFESIGLVHFDIKPENLIFRNHNNESQLCLVDLGFATFLNKKGIVDGQSGTLGYAAPEIKEGTVTDCRADIYSLGVVFYILLTGGSTLDV